MQIARHKCLSDEKLALLASINPDVVEKMMQQCVFVIHPDYRHMTVHARAMLPMMDWIESEVSGFYHITGNAIAGAFSIMFENAADMVNFKLRWEGNTE